MRLLRLLRGRVTVASLVAAAIDRLAAGEAGLPSHHRLIVLTNVSAQSADGRWVAEVLQSRGQKPNALLTPEHGLEARAEAGESIPHGEIDGIPVLSMYGGEEGAVEAAVAKSDLLVIDLPDVGCRYYTYEWTMREALKLAASYGVRAVVLDRPNPLGGTGVEGSLPDHTSSPVCASHVPVRHGLTLGELARRQVRELTLDLDLDVIPARGWRRDMLWPQTGLPWVPPSPALRSFEAALLYPGTCLLEGTNVSEGRGTDAPFQLVGAPFVDADALAGAVNNHADETGIVAEPIDFVPTSGKWADTLCRGIGLHPSRPEMARPLLLGLVIVGHLARLPDFTFSAYFDTLAGTPRWRGMLLQGDDPRSIAAGWQADERRFRQERTDVVLY
jgi:uncharacterized protein YbbC (DUF1343 family)